MKQISTTSPFLQNALFINDKYKFSLVGHNLGLEETRIYSDEETYIFVLGKSHKPIWLWTTDDVSKEKIVRVDNEYDMPSKINFQNITKIFLLHDITSYEQSMVIEEKIKREFSK